MCTSVRLWSVCEGERSVNQSVHPVCAHGYREVPHRLAGLSRMRKPPPLAGTGKQASAAVQLNLKKKIRGTEKHNNILSFLLKIS